MAIQEPYLLQEKGWGEFDMRVELFFKNNLAPPENIFFDLHFREHTYTIMHKIIFQNPSPELIRLLSIEIPDPPPILNMINNDFKKRRTSPPLPGTKKIKTPPSTSDVKYPSSPSSHIDNDVDDLYRHGYRPQRKPQTGGIIDDIYTEKDIHTANPIHSKILDDKVRNAWGLPEVSNTHKHRVVRISDTRLGLGYVGIGETTKFNVTRTNTRSRVHYIE